MTAIIHRDADVALSPLEQRRIAILGYGSQGRAQALNLRDGGFSVIVAELPDADNHRQAAADGFRPVSAAEAVEQSDVIAVLLPDEIAPEVFRDAIRGGLSPGDVLIFAHGFNVRYGLIDPPEGVAAVLVAPMGPGSLVREKFQRGGGVPCLIAAAEGAQAAKPLALAYAKAIGATRAGAIESTFAEETETDLFAEQAVLCGGINALVLAAFDTLVEAGYQPEIAYNATVHEIKQTVDLLQQLGPAGMGGAISNTAEYGDLTRGPRIIDKRVKTEMRRILDEIRDGRFAREWIDECRSGGARFEQLRRKRQSHPIEEIGRRMRET
ncbi:MAG: ketol-acid reductoisomerase [Pirellulaceae bacterium]|nr:ketol-acid reductoisomerase [Pirellulaceae bacterium]